MIKIMNYHILNYMKWLKMNIIKFLPNLILMKKRKKMKKKVIKKIVIMKMEMIMMIVMMIIGKGEKIIENLMKMGIE